MVGIQEQSNTTTRIQCHEINFQNKLNSKVYKYCILTYNIIINWFAGAGLAKKRHMMQGVKLQEENGDGAEG